MPRAVLDTSVLVSAFLSPGGTPAKVVGDATHGAYVLCLSDEILGEFIQALRKLERRQASFRYDHDQVTRYVRDLTIEAVLVTDLPELPGVTLDPKDDMIVATAVAAKADYLVTGDQKHLLPLGSYEGIRIVTPRAFLEELGKRPTG